MSFQEHPIRKFELSLIDIIHSRNNFFEFRNDFSLTYWNHEKTLSYAIFYDSGTRQFFSNSDVIS